MGELVRREAEIAIAPLTINSQREQASLTILRDSNSSSHHQLTKRAGKLKNIKR